MENVTFTYADERYDINLTEEFSEGLNAMEYSDENLFITGKAGTGKSMLLKYFCSTTSKKVAILAPTGLAALNVGGQTIHSFFRFAPRLLQPGEIRYNRQVADIVARTDAIIIDEISMVRADLMDGIDISLRKYKKKNLPFGGMQMIFFGDLFQLPPIVQRDLYEYFSRQYYSPYFFSARVFDDAKIYSYKMDRIHRQKDASFIGLLNNVREGNYVEDTIEQLNNRYGLMPEESESAVILTATNDRAKRHNDYFMSRIDGPVYTYEAKIKGKLKADGPYLEKLELKVGAKIMFIKNDSEKRWVNGDFGKVTKLDGSKIEVEVNGQVEEVKKEKWEAIQYKANDDGTNISIEKDVVGSASQFPLKPGWAITIHKSQGQTFNDIILDLGSYGAFAFGQLYVALSRARTLEGIYLKEQIKYSDIKVDEGLVDAESQLLRKSINDIPRSYNLFDPE